MSVHRCCQECDENAACNCLGDCNDFQNEGAKQAAECWDCCWAPGDAIRLKATWGGSLQRRETFYPGLNNAGPKCADVTYQGGEVEVEYVVVGCSRQCPLFETDRVKVIFALNTDFGDVEYLKSEQKWVVQTDVYRYVLETYLALVCQTVTDGEGNGDWRWVEYTSCAIPPRLLSPCVALCQTDCQDVDYVPCNQIPTDSFCAGGIGLQPPSPDFYNCERCVDALVSCGGLKSYCCYRWVDSECAFNGNEYGLYVNAQGQPECGYGCGADAVGGFHPITTCLTAVVQTLELAPPNGSTRHCQWHEWTDQQGNENHCCRNAAEGGGEDLEEPQDLEPLCPLNQSYPDDWIGPECDCTASPITPANCEPLDCPAGTTVLVSSGAKAVCL